MSSTVELIEKSLRIFPNSKVADTASRPVTTDNAMNMIFFRNKPSFRILNFKFSYFVVQLLPENLFLVCHAGTPPFSPVLAVIININVARPTKTPECQHAM